MPNNNKTNIRGIDPQIYHLARVAAVSQGITIGQLVNTALQAYLGQPAKPK